MVRFFVLNNVKNPAGRHSHGIEAWRNQNPQIILESCDKQLLGLICAKIRSFRMPEPYKGKGILFKGEVIRRKSGKSAAAK